MAPLFEALGAPLPDRVRVAIGFTSAGRRSRAIGECWDNRLSADGHFKIFIRPDLAHAPDAMPAQIAAILAHELVHAAVGIKAGHGRPFKRIALGLGLVGPMRATTPGEVFLAEVAPILAAAGPLPHAHLDTGGLTTAPRKQAARMLKCECQACGYTVRTARKWLETAGAPLCPIPDHGAMRHEPFDGEDEPEGGAGHQLGGAAWGPRGLSPTPVGFRRGRVVQFSFFPNSHARQSAPTTMSGGTRWSIPS